MKYCNEFILYGGVKFEIKTLALVMLQRNGGKAAGRAYHEKCTDGAAINTKSNQRCEFTE